MTEGSKEPFGDKVQSYCTVQTDCDRLKMSGAGSAEDVVKQIQDVQGRDISLEEKNRLINSILSHSSSRYSFPSRFILIPVKLEPSAGAT